MDWDDENALYNEFHLFHFQSKCYCTIVKLYHIYSFVDADDCVGVTCDNGGTCEDGVDEYSCQCVLGYGGEHCEIGKDNFSQFLQLQNKL